MNSDDIKEYIVCINGGSGVIFQPADRTSTYLLTARHVLDDIADNPYNGDLVIHYFNRETNSFEQIPPFQPTDANYFPHPDADVDIAIIKVPRLNSPSNQIFLLTLDNDRTNFLLAGFSNQRREDANMINWIRHDERMRIKGDKAHQRREASIPGNPTYQELVGMSGGGIFKLSEDYLILAGIQSRIPNRNEALGNVDYTPINVFNEIATPENGIETILPCYMKDFDFLRESAFNLDITLFNEEQVIPLQNYLRKKATDVINTGVTPIGIKNFFEKRLLVDEKQVASLEKSHIWTAWLEFLTIMNIVKYETFDEANLNAIFNSTRLKYINYNEDWTLLCKEHLQQSDYHGLPVDSKVFIATPIDPKERGIIERGTIVGNIGRSYEKAKFKTDSGIDPFSHFTFIHTSVLKTKYITDRLAAYQDINDDETLLITFKQQYDELFG